MRRVVFVLILAQTLGLISEIQASTSQSAVLFLRIAAGARAAGMGETFVAIADDATATHWNPAGLGKYPLYSEWYEHFLPAKVTLKQIALLRNDVPDNNFSRFDIWGITNTDLYHWDGVQWRSWQEIKTGEQSLQSFLSKSIGQTDPEQLKALAHRVASFNYPVSYDSLQVLAERCKSLLPADYPLQKNFGLLWTQLLEAWEGLRIIPENFNKLLSTTRTVLADGNLNRQETEQIYFALEKSFTSSPPSAIRVPYRVFLADSLTALASDQENTLWIGTPQGLYSFDGEGIWKKFGLKEGVLDTNVVSLASGPNGALWVGGVSGLSRYIGGHFNPVLEFNPELLGGPPRYIHLKNERSVWLAAESSLVYFDGSNWKSFVNYVVKVGDTPEKVAREYLGRQDDRKITEAVSQIKKINSLSSDELPPNTTLMLPFRLAMEGEITALTVDKKDHLWLGTSAGIKTFDGQAWHNFGYALYTVSQPGETPEGIAGKFLQSKDAKKVNALADKIREYNHLDTTSLAVGQKLYVYRNASGSRILSIEAPGREEVYVGTEFGTLRYDSGMWSRYYHAGLERDKTYSIISREGEMWLSSTNKVTVYAHAKKEFTFMFAKWLPELASDLYYAYASYVQNLEGWGTVGANITFLNLGTSERTGETGEVLGEFTSYDAALTLSYGTKFSPTLALGMSAKFIYSNLAAVGAGREQGSGTGSSFALDAGLLYRTPWKRLTLGAAITNLGPDITYIDADQSDPLPRNLAIGFAYRLVDSPYNRLTLVGEMNKELVGVKDNIKTEYQEAIWNTGLEYWYGSYLALRAGYIYDRVGQVKTPTFGGTLQYSNYHFDLAYIPARQDLALSNTLRLSITARF
jgi:ligand-binding sensor domain-containing protein